MLVLHCALLDTGGLDVAGVQSLGGHYSLTMSVQNENWASKFC
jgi:hypothetical protein